MLDRYENDLRVGLISGTNYFGQYNFGGYDYGFVKTGAIWGWATWKNRWDKYDFYANSVNNDYIVKCLELDVSRKKRFSKKRVNTWKTANKDVLNELDLSYWDFQWGLTRYINSFLSIVPKKNLISNIGCNAAATHESNLFLLPKKNRMMQTQPYYEFKIEKYPDFVIADRSYDLKYYNLIYPNIIRSIYNKGLKLLKLIYLKVVYHDKK